LRFYRDRPTVTGLGIAITLQDDALASLVSFDLIQATTQAVPLAGAASTLPIGIIEGALNQACERSFFEIGANKVAQTITGDFISVGRVFEAAAKAGIAVTTLSAGSQLPSDLATALSPSAQTQVSKYLAQGFVVIVPTTPVQLGSQTVTGFWAVDPMTGRTIDRMEGGGGSELAENATLLDIVLEAVHEMYVMATCIVGIGFAAGCLLAMVIDGYSDGKLAGAVGGAVHGGGFCLGAAM